MLNDSFEREDVAILSILQRNKEIPKDALKHYVQWRSQSSFYKRLRELKKHRLVDETEGKTVYLTNFGSWLSELGTISLQTYEFAVKAFCRKCSTNRKAVIMKPLIETAHISEKEILNIESTCPLCKTKDFYFIHSMSIDNFTEMYRRGMKILERHFAETIFKNA